MAQKPVNRWQTSIGRGLRLWLVVFMIGAIPIMSNYLYNRYEVSVQAMVLPLLALTLVASFVAAIFYRLSRRDPLAGLGAEVIAAVMLTNNYDDRFGNIYPALSALLPLPKLDGAQASIVSLSFIALILLGAHLAGRLISQFVRGRGWPARDLRLGVIIALSLTFVIMLIPTAKSLIAAWPQFFYKPPAIAANLSASASKPDIYYIVMEDYANQTQLSNQFNFSNADFLNYLTKNGYYTNPDSHQNYPYTTMSIASTLSADYNTDMINRFGAAGSQSIVPYHRAIQYAPVVSALKGLGYQYDEIGTWYETTNRAPLADNFYLPDRRLTIMGQTTHIDGFTQAQLSETVFWRWLQLGLKFGNFTLAQYQGEGQTQLTGDALSTLKNLANQPAGGRFIFAHLIIPHEPYYFNADGSMSSYSGDDDYGQLIKQKYLGQLQYINSRIKPILESIKANSQSQAIVILQSDEGPQPQALNDHLFNEGGESTEINNQDMRSWNDSDLALKYGNFAAYSIPNASASDLATGASNLNVFRLIMNRYFGASLPILPECYYAFPNGRAHTFVYDDVTSRITSAANPVCAANGTGPK